MAPKLYLFHGTPGSRTVMITAAALAIPLDLHPLDFTTGEHTSSEYLKLNPQHTAPTLEDNGEAIWDSHAIIAYLVRKYAKDDSLYPKDFHKRGVVDQRLHFDSGVLYPTLRSVDMALFTKEVTAVPARKIGEIKEGYGFLETFLEGRKWVAGDSVTVADFSLAPTVLSLNYHCKLEAKTYPNIFGWLNRCQGLSCFAQDKEEQKVFDAFFSNL